MNDEKLNIAKSWEENLSRLKEWLKRIEGFTKNKYSKDQSMEAANRLKTLPEMKAHGFNRGMKSSYI